MNLKYAYPDHLCLPPLHGEMVATVLKGRACVLPDLFLHGMKFVVDLVEG